MTIFIPGNVPSSKNSREFNQQRKKSFASKATSKWRRTTERFWRQYRREFLSQLELTETPYRIKFTFVRGTRHKFDYTNPLQTVQDEMVRHKWIEDDNCDILLPSFGLYRYSKEHPGVHIQILF